jgi:hypothetical protein
VTLTARLALALALITTTGAASGAVRRLHFEPDDLDLEQPGILDLDFQAGPLHGDSAGKGRLLLPDFEIGLGLTHNVELDVSGAFSIDQNRGEPHQLSSDPLWVAAKLGLFDEIDELGNSWALGVELGPRFPVVDAAGVGFGALGLLGFTHRRLTLVLNGGALIDPGPTRSAQHPTGIVLGLDLNQDLDAKGVWSVQSEVGTAYYLTSDPHELSFTFGATYSVTPRLDLSLTALGGFLPNTDHAGILLGVSPELDLW